MKILIGTNNENKLTQFRRIFKRHLPELEIISLKEAGIYDDVEEDADNLQDNARKKAKFYGESSGFLSLGDDTGLFIDALGGEPGIHAKRWHEGTEKERYLKVLERMKDIPEERTARYTGVLVVYDPVEKIFWEYEGKLEGTIAREPFEGYGFGYDPIFNTLSYGKYYSQLTDDERDAISHRGMGVREFAQYFKTKYL